MCLIYSDNPAGQQQISRMFLTYLTQQESRNNRRHKSDSYFGITELGLRHGQRKVAEGSEATTSRNSCPVHRCNRRLRKVIQGPEQAAHLFGVFQSLLRGASHERPQILQVHARAECLACSRKNQHQSGRIGDFVHRRQQIFDQLVADRVALVRTIERKHGDSGAICELECFVFQSAAAEIVYRAPISVVARKSTSKDFKDGRTAPRAANTSTSFSVAILPTRAS